VSFVRKLRRAFGELDVVREGIDAIPTIEHADGRREPVLGELGELGAQLREDLEDLEDLAERFGGRRR